jgi:hypothetical protein
VGAVAPCSGTSEKSQVESCEHQDNANVDCQPFQESVFKKHEIYTDDDTCHRHHVKRDRKSPTQFSFHGLYGKERDGYPQKRNILLGAPICGRNAESSIALGETNCFDARVIL